MSTQKEKRRTFYLILPLLVLPFLALGFWALGGGKGKIENEKAAKGLNTALPEANFKNEKQQDKLGLYEQQKEGDSLAFPKEFAELAGVGNDSSPEEQENEIERKLEQIQKEINQPEKKRMTTAYPSYSPQSTSMTADVQRLEYLMKNIQSEGEEDPEIKQLSSVMDKILELQNPERFKEKYESKIASSPDSQFRAIPAIIDGAQKITYGSLIRLKLLDSIELNGQIIPKNHLLFGSAVLSNQRVLLDIKTIRLDNSIVPVNLSVYSLDGIKGIDAPEALLTETAAGGADNALRNIQVLSTDQSLVGQVAGAGFDAAKTLFSKKVKRIKVRLKAGQTILLRNNELKISGRTTKP